MTITGKLKNFDWLAVVFYPLAVILMESFWVYPWLIWVGLWPTFNESRPVLSLASVIIILLVSLVMTRIILNQPWPMRYKQGAIIGGGIVLILLVLGIDYNSGYGFLSIEWFSYVGQTLGTTFKSPQTIVVALPVMLYLWWRGINLGNTTSYFRSIYRSFLLGLVCLIFLIIIWQLSSGEESFAGPGSEVGFYVMAFFFFGLMAVAICQLYIMRRSMSREEAAGTSVWRWLPIMLGVIGGMVVVGFVVASVFSADFFADIAHGFGIIRDFIGKIVSYILIPLIYIFEAIVWVIRWLINLVRSDTPFEPQEPGGSPFGNMEEVGNLEVPPIVTDIARWLVILVIVAVVLFILARAVARLRTERRLNEIEEIHESLWSLNTLRDDLKELFASLGKRFQGTGPASSKYSFDDKGRLNVRDIYKHLQWEAARSGKPRRHHETAKEYAKRLESWVPDGTDPLEGITDLYTEVRYGEIEVPEKKVDNANTFWGTLRGLLRRARGE